MASVGTVKDLVESATELAQHHLSTPELQQRWMHVQGVALRATELSLALDHQDRTILVAAAWLHDIGYAPDIIMTGMHSIDGAIFLREHGYPQRVIALVAHHTGARFEAAERGLTQELDHFPREESAVADALAAADLTTTPTGAPTGVEERIDEILRRYPDGSAVHRAISRARPSLVVQAERALGFLA